MYFSFGVVIDALCDGACSLFEVGIPVDHLFAEGALVLNIIRTLYQFLSSLSSSTSSAGRYPLLYEISPWNRGGLS